MVSPGATMHALIVGELPKQWEGDRAPGHPQTEVEVFASPELFLPCPTYAIMTGNIEEMNS